MTITSLNIAEGTVKERPRCRPKYLITTGIVLLVIIGVIVAYFVGAFDAKDEPKLVPPNPLKPLPASRSHLRKFNKAAVCADAQPCAEIGKSILEKNGSAVDSAIATLFCTGIISMQSMGLGGGFFMTIYIKENETAYSVNAREVAPLNATEEMFGDDPLKPRYGPLSFGVPGELSGYWEAYKRFGRLPWKDLVQPSVELCENGFNLTRAQYIHFDKIKKDDLLRQWFMEPDGTFKSVGTLIKPEPLCKTLKIIAENGALDFYNGTISKLFLQDVKELGGIITAEDLANYKAKIEDPIKVDLKNGDKLFSTPPPGSGLLLGFIMNILSGYDLNPSSIDGIENTIVTYHRIIEAFKYAFAKRTELADPDFVDMSELVNNLTSTEFANAIRAKIKDNATSLNPKDYGAVFYSKDGHGTAHISILAENGDAVSVTSTVNIYFGAGVTSKRTGIIFNGGMDDFSFPNIINYFGLPGSPSNAMVPKKRPLSSMTPAVIVDADGDVKMVVGAAGGTKITTATALAMIRSIWLGQNIKEAVDAPRFHHQIFPMAVQYEYGVINPIVNGLEAIGHKTQRFTDAGSIVCALVMNNGTIYANADFRKGGDVYGLD